MSKLNTILDTLAFIWVLSGFAAPILVPAISDMFLGSAPTRSRPAGRWTARAPTG